MIDQIVAIVGDESKWLAASLSAALLAVAVLLVRHRRPVLPGGRRAMAAMNLFFAVTIGTMALGHLLAVTAKLLAGTLEGSVTAFYAIGVALAVPSWSLGYHTRRMLAPHPDQKRTTVLLNGWVALTLLGLGLHNLPLAAPGILNIGYRLRSGRTMGRVILGLALVANLGLFIGSLIFLASGQSFEQFRGM